MGRACAGGASEMKHIRTVVLVSTIAVTLGLVIAGKYSPCRDDDSFWWAVQHTAGNQCWAWQDRMWK